MKRIGILGGTFNPIHIGHLAMGQVALERLKLDKVIFVPSCVPPHKTIKNLASAQDRLKMVHIATNDNPKFEVSDIEIRRKGRSYSIDTVRYFREHYPKGTKFYFIVGGDSAEELHTWKDIDELARLVTFVALNRPGFKSTQEKYKCRAITMPALEISSSYLRQCFASGGSALYLLRYHVSEYIKKKKLYGIK